MKNGENQNFLTAIRCKLSQFKMNEKPRQWKFCRTSQFYANSWYLDGFLQSSMQDSSIQANSCKTPVLPCCAHARREWGLSPSLGLHLGEHSTLPSCLLCVKTPKAAKLLTSSCILTCLYSRNTFPRFLSKLQTCSSRHGFDFFFRFPYSLQFIYTCLHCMCLIPSPSEVWYIRRKWMSDDWWECYSKIIQICG